MSRVERMKNNYVNYLEILFCKVIEMPRLKSIDDNVLE